jgi:hypothetical protein
MAQAGANYEFFRMAWQEKFVGWTLPQDNAIVSKTLS